MTNGTLTLVLLLRSAMVYEERREKGLEVELPEKHFPETAQVPLNKRRKAREKNTIS